MTAEVPTRPGSRSSLVWDILTEVMASRAAQAGRASLDVVDVGAGTGGFAVGIAGLGHRVTVVDPSPDALAAARWRAAEAGVTLTVVQGEASDLPALVGEPGGAEPGDTGAGAAAAGADLVICHNVLEYVDSPPAALAAIARVLRPGGTVSVLAANAVAAVLQRALAGKYAEARALLPGGALSPGTGSPGTGSPGTGSPGTGSPGTGSPGPGSSSTGSPDTGAPGPAGATAPRRFTLPELTALIEGAGLRPGDAHGIRIFSSLLPGAGADPAAADALRELEEAAATCPPLRDIATRLHLLASRA